MLQKQESTEADSAAQRSRTRGRTRFSQTPDYAEVSETLKEVSTKRSSEVPKRRNEAPRSRNTERPPSNRRPYEVEEAVDESPRKSRTRVITESRFESKTASPPQLFQPVSTSNPLKEIPLEAISKTFTTSKLEKTTEAVSEPASASSADPSTTKEEVPATEPISEVSRVTSETVSERESTKAHIESTTSISAARRGRVNVRLRGNPSETSTTQSPRGRAKARTGRRNEAKNEEVAQQTAPVAHVVLPNSKLNRGSKRSQVETQEETVPVRSSSRSARKNSKGALDLTAEGRQDERRREVRGYSQSRSNAVTNTPEVSPAARANIVRTTRKPQHDRQESNASIKADVVVSHNPNVRRNNRQEREHSASSTERNFKTPSRTHEQKRIKARTSSTTQVPISTRTATADARIRGRLTSNFEEQKLEVLPLVESVTATVRIAPPSNIAKRKYENEVSAPFTTTTTATTKRVTSRLTTPKPKAKREETTTVNPTKPLVRETVQVSHDVKEVTTKRKVVRRKKLDNRNDDNAGQIKTTERSLLKTSVAQRREGNAENIIKHSSTVRAPTKKHPKPPLEYYDRKESIFPSSTDPALWDTTDYRDKITFEPDHNSAWLGFDKNNNKFFSETTDSKNYKTETPKPTVLDTSRSFDYRNEIISDVPEWRVSYQVSNVPTTPLRRETTTQASGETRVKNKGNSTVKERSSKKAKATEAPSERRITERYHKTSTTHPSSESHEHRQKQAKATTERTRTNEDPYRQREKQHYKTTAVPLKRTSERVQTADNENNYRHRENQQYKSTVVPDKKSNERVAAQEIYDHQQREVQQLKTVSIPNRTGTSESTSSQQPHFRQKQHFKTNTLPDRTINEDTSELSGYDSRQKERQRTKITVSVSLPESRQREKQPKTTTVIPLGKTTAERHHKPQNAEVYDYRSKERQVKATTETYDRRSSERRKTKSASTSTPKEYSRKSKGAILVNEATDGKNNERKLYSDTAQEQRSSTLATETPERRGSTRLTSITTTTVPTTTTSTTVTIPSTTSRISTTTYVSPASRTTRLYNTSEASDRPVTSTEKQRIREEAKATVTQVVTKTRGSKKTGQSVSEERKKKSSSKEEEDIDESDNYPEPFKALIQAKKEKETPPRENAKVG